MFLLPCVYAFFACIGFCIVFEIHSWKYIVAASSCGAFSWLTYILLDGKISEGEKYFVATIVVAILAEIMARVFKEPATVFLIVGIIPLVPGGALYDTMDYLIQGETSLFEHQALQTASYAIAIAVGCSLVSSLVKIITYRQPRYKK